MSEQQFAVLHRLADLRRILESVRQAGMPDTTWHLEQDIQKYAWLGEVAEAVVALQASVAALAQAQQALLEQVNDLSKQLAALAGDVPVVE